MNMAMYSLIFKNQFCTSFSFIGKCFNTPSQSWLVTLKVTGPLEMFTGHRPLGSC